MPRCIARSPAMVVTTATSKQSGYPHGDSGDHRQQSTLPGAPSAQGALDRYSHAAHTVLAAWAWRWWYRRILCRAPHMFIEHQRLP